VNADLWQYLLLQGLLPDKIPDELFSKQTLDLDPFNYVKQIDELSNPAKTSIDGVFVAGAASGPMDIPDSILSAGAASSETAAFLRRSK